MTWFVQLTGDATDLAALARSMNDSDATIMFDNGEYFLTSERIADDAEPAIARARAQEIVEIISGAVRLALEAPEPIRVGAVHRRHDDGRRDFFLFPEPAVIQLRGFAPTITITRADGTIDEVKPSDPIKDWTKLAFSNEAVSNVLRIFANGANDWVNLYRIFEIVCADVGGLDDVATRGWGAKGSMKLFKHTANSPGVLGLEARHGAEDTLPPPKPMTIAEARALIAAIAHAWLRDHT